MANEEFEELGSRIAGYIQKLIDYPEEDRSFWQARPYYPSAVRAQPLPLGKRELELRRDLQVFRSAVTYLREWGRKTMPGIYFMNGPLPSSPRDQRLTLSNDPTSATLREAWASHRGRGPDMRRDHVDDGSVIEIPLDESKRIFSNGLASALVMAAANRSTGLIHFTVHAQNDSYRVHVTEQYWFNPVVFGSRLSTPVDDMIEPANYRFGGEKVGGPIIWDSGIHTASPSHTSTTVVRF
jgi:hypothetical protein